MDNQASVDIASDMCLRNFQYNTEMFVNEISCFTLTDGDPSVIVWLVFKNGQ